MTDLRKAAEMALEALEHFNQGNSPAVVQGEFDDEIESLRQALAEPANSTTNFVEPKTPVQQEQEPTQEIYAVLFAVEEAVRNGCASWDIEAAFEKYEAKLKEIK
jgi:hypothetical protein